jgi:hypothetical protein
MIVVALGFSIKQRVHRGVATNHAREPHHEHHPHRPAARNGVNYSNRNAAIVLGAPGIDT